MSDLTDIIEEISRYRDRIETNSKDETGRTDTVGMIKVHVLDKLIMHLRRKFKGSIL